MVSTKRSLNVVFRLAQETSLVLLNGGGFDGPEWSVRASLANLNESEKLVGTDCTSFHI